MTRAGGLFPAPLPQDSPVCDKVCKYFWFLGVFLAKVYERKLFLFVYCLHHFIVHYGLDTLLGTEENGRILVIANLYRYYKMEDLSICRFQNLSYVSCAAKN